MKYSGIGFILIGLLIIVFPQIIGYVVGGLFLIVGISSFTFANKFGKKKSPNGESYVKFGNYKIYR